MSERWEQPLYKEVERIADDLLADGGDYGYGGEWHSRKEIDVEAVTAFIEAKLKEQREQIAKDIEGERDHPSRGWNDSSPKPGSFADGLFTGFKESFTAAAKVVREGPMPPHWAARNT